MTYTILWRIILKAERLNRIIEFIKNKQENELVDFKERYYHSNTKYDLIKDIMSFSNNLSNEEKYIIFGIEDTNKETLGIQINDLPDISEINNLIKSYCDPFINVEMETFKYENCDLGVLVVCSNNYERPYVVKKDYSFKGVNKLNSGDIYIRKSANNFKASRNDLEEIYANRDIVNVISDENNVFLKDITIGRKKEKMCCIPIKISNNSNKNFAICKGIVHWVYTDTNTGTDIFYIENECDNYKVELHKITSIPFNINANSQYKKNLLVSIKPDFLNIISKRLDMGEKPDIVVKLYDCQNRELKIKFHVNNLMNN